MSHARLPALAGWGLCALLVSGPSFAQQEDIRRVGTVHPYHYVAKPADNQGTATLLVDKHVVRFPKASFLSLELDGVVLGEGSALEITSLEDGDSEVLTDETFNWASPHTAYFNGEAVEVKLWAAPGTKGNTYSIKSASVGDIPPDVVGPTTLCDGKDDRVPSADKRVARLLFRRGSSTFVCTAWLMSPTNCFGTAGHCLASGSTALVVQFNVPTSTSTGAIRNPSSIYQYGWLGSASSAFESGGVGKDWAVFLTGVNGTGRHAGQNQGSWFSFATSMRSNGSTLRVTGHGADSTPRSYNFIQQTDTGAQRSLSASALYHRVDTEGGNSGGPIVYDVSGTQLVVGTHTHGGCTTSVLSANAGTRADYAPFVAARNRLCNHQPNLRPSALTPSSTTLVAGNTYQIRSVIQNIGTGSVPQSEAGYYVSTNNIISTADLLVYKFNVGPLPAFWQWTWITNVTMPVTLPHGTCYLGVYADHLRKVAESNEADNTLAVRVTCVGRPDLTVSALSCSPTAFAPKQTITVSSTIRNVGVNSSAACSSGHYLSTNSVISTGDTLLAAWTTPALVPGGFHNQVTKVLAPSSLPTGICYIGAIADRLGTIAERSETNNTRALQVTCLKPAPDLAVQSFTASTTVWVAGTTIVTLDSLTKNIGSATAPASTNGYYMSTNNIISSADKLLHSFGFGSMAVNGTGRWIAKVRMPADLRPGTCFVGVFVDRTSSIPELSETNNTRAIAGSCVGKPDLVISALTATPNPLTAGSSVAVTSTTRNIGTAAAGATNTGIFLSTNSTISTADSYLGHFNVGILGVGAFRTLTTKHGVPYCTKTGTCYIGAFADFTGAASELSETNNTRAVATRCVGYTGRSRILEWVPIYPITTSSATFSGKTGGSGRICITAPSIPNHFYLLVWSGSSGSFSYDSLSAFSLSLVNSVIFPGWFGKLDADGYGAAGFNLPKVVIGAPFTAYTHAFFFTPGFGFAGTGSNTIRSVFVP